MKKRPVAIPLLVLLSFSLVAAIVYRIHAKHEAQNHEAACYRANVEKLRALEPAAATLNAEVQQIQADQDVIDQLDGTDDEKVIERRHLMIDGVKLKLTKVNRDREENQRRSEEIQSELATCLAAVQ